MSQLHRRFIMDIAVRFNALRGMALKGAIIKSCGISKVKFDNIRSPTISYRYCTL